MTVNWNETRSFLESKMQAKPEIGLILGSGLGVLADEIENPIAIPYHEIPNFPVSTVEGHAGQLVFGTLEGKQVVAMQGRFHFYEGYSMDMVTFPVRVMKAIGVETLIVTNAAGACNEAFEPGDLMLITDHINFFGTNPLIGKNVDEMGPRFPDMSKPYDAELLRLAQETADELGIRVRQGVYFETLVRRMRRQQKSRWHGCLEETSSVCRRSLKSSLPVIPICESLGSHVSRTWQQVFSTNRYIMMKSSKRQNVSGHTSYHSFAVRSKNVTTVYKTHKPLLRRN